ncbi:hypothetical protein [Solibacillus sp. NPDC093137]|uniref:hypothetical protein n=1 Tax=Solibacillus sp. NPDC093137 TaxID=3390678 RepID=UPI003D002C3B
MPVKDEDPCLFITVRKKVSYVSRDDLAVAAAGLLLSEGHDGTIYTGTGPKTLTGAERAETIAKASGKPFNFVTVLLAYDIDILRALF